VIAIQALLCLEFLRRYLRQPFLALPPTNLLNCPIVDSHALPFILQLSSGPKNEELNKEVSNGGHCSPFGNDSHPGTCFPSCQMERVQKEVKVGRARWRRFLEALDFGGFVVVRQVRHDATAIPAQTGPSFTLDGYRKGNTCTNIGITPFTGSQFRDPRRSGIAEA